MNCKIFLFLVLVLQALQPAMGQTILTSPEPIASGLFGISVSIQGGTIVASDNPLNGSNLRHVYAFKDTGGNWIQDGELENPAQVANDDYGRSVSVDGDYAVVGASGVSGEQGKAYVFKRTGASTWNLEATLSGSDVVAGDKFGTGVAISGTSLVVGAPAKNNGIGSAYVFNLAGGTWTEVAKLVPANAPNGRFGTWLTMHEGYIAVAAHQREKVFVYKQAGNTWAQQALLEPPVADGSFGVNCSIFKDRLIVGALNDDEMGNNAGAVYVYKRTGDTWALEQKLFAEDAAASKSFGGRIALSEHYAVIGTLYEVFDVNGTDGSAYIFKRNGTTWTQMEKYNTPEFDYMGWYNAINGNTAVVGAYGADFDLDNSGAIYVYDLPAVVSANREVAVVDLAIYPNPASDFVRLDFPADSVPGSITLLGQDGKVLQVWPAGQHTIPIGHLTPGSYYFQVDLGKQTGIGSFTKL
ncbi:MAG: hypothetical protein H6577_24440 [Lewinellaceae bacterium]|nr:hypothetical protein [Saprospiraceae bacterium]MCB9341284.1 hypothetical protein [Lewinellaceae bacterium]